MQNSEAPWPQAGEPPGNEVSFLLCPLTPPTCLPAGGQGGARGALAGQLAFKN